VIGWQRLDAFLQHRLPECAEGDSLTAALLCVFELPQRVHTRLATLRDDVLELRTERGVTDRRRRALKPALDDCGV